MNRQQANRRIAEILGWTEVECYEDPIIKSLGLAPGEDGRNFCPPPEYCADLNACHEMEKALSGDDWRDYAAMLWLYDTTLKDGDWMIKSRTHATAEQRAEAFLRVKDPSFFT